MGHKNKFLLSPALFWGLYPALRRFCNGFYDCKSGSMAFWTGNLASQTPPMGFRSLILGLLTSFLGFRTSNLGS